ncbi:MAG TPA: hypothetical protein VFA03_04655 [Acetobacteraceae bacterium]|nr:hypothetical protein [Acetobacteraceae bacterium]
MPPCVEPRLASLAIRLALLHNDFSALPEPAHRLELRIERRLDIVAAAA